MTLLQLAVLAVVQGITEFLPISSSGHLVLAPHVMDWPDQGLLIDVAVHVGTLLAVCLYFARDLGAMALALTRARRKESRKHLNLLSYIVLATIPVVAVGFFAKDYISLNFRSVELVAWTTLGFGILLGIADKISMTVNRLEHLTLTKALFIGVAQILALIPGTSRAGITMTAARLLGFERTAAAKFSMLMSIPVILGAGILASLDLAAQDNMALTQDALLAGLIAFVTALLAIWILMGWLKRSSFTPFVLYRIALGGGLMYWVYWM